MTDKQIIINDQKKTIHRLQDECTEKTNIIIALGEQLDQLKVENERLERQLKFEFDETLLQYSNELDRLKAENDELKDLNTRLDNQRETYWKGYQKLKNCSTEIKEIAEKIDDSGGCDYGDYDCDNCSSLEQETVCTYKVKKLILQKISDLEV